MTSKLNIEIHEQKRQTLGLLQQIDEKCEQIERLEQEAASAIVEKSKLQGGVLKDKELVMTLQTENAQLRLDVKELELSVEKRSQDQPPSQSSDKQQIIQELLQSNLEL